MSARSVCSGSCPCRYHSDRAISAPFRRPDTRTLIPRAPKRSADSTAFRIARLKATRFSSCIATDSEMSCASSSGFWISWMLMKTSRLVRFWISCFSLSTSVPFRPMMMPGRGVDVDLQLVRGALGLDARDARVREALLQVRPEGEILVEQLRVVAVRVPARAPGLVEAEAESVRMNLLAH